MATKLSGDASLPHHKDSIAYTDDLR
jgi:hypothetical protein